MAFNVFKKQSDGKLILDAVLQTSSIVWEEGFNVIGKLQAVLPKSDDAIATVKVGCFATVDTSPLMYYVYGIKVTDTELWAYGYECKALLQKQQYDSILGGNYQGTTNLRNAIVAACEDYVDYSFVYEGSYFYSLNDIGTANLDASDALDMYEFIRRICALKNCGFWMQYDDGSRKLIINGRQGEDKSQTAVFSTMLGNAWGVKYSQDDQTNVNTVYVYGVDAITDPEYPDMVVGTATNRQTGEERLAVIIDKRTEFPRPENMTLADYQDALNTRAQMSLIARHTQQKLEVSNIDTSGYGTAYKLGDVVAILIPEYGVSYKMRITTVRHTTEGNYDDISFTLTLATD